MHLKKHSDIDLSRANPVIFIRHAQSEGQVKSELYRSVGDENLALTQQGLDQARSIGNRLASAFHQAAMQAPILYAGASLRTQTTAQEIAKAFGNSNIIIDPRINKQSFGKFDGLLTSAEKQQAMPDLYAAYKDDKNKLGDLAVTPPEGESILDVIERVRNFLQETSQSQRPIIAVTHGLQMLCAEKIAGHKSDGWLLDTQDSVANVEAFTFHLDN